MKLFVIPTHRDCKKAVDSIIKEILQIDNKDVALAVVDNSKENVFFENNCFLYSLLKKQYPFPMYHFGLNHMNQIIRTIAEQSGVSKDRLHTLIYPIEVDYGKISNIIYIIASILQATSIHRRDSDCFVDQLNVSDYPVLQEDHFINKSAKNTGGLTRQENIIYDDSEKICIVGGDYFGNWDIDIEEIILTNPDAMKTLMAICEIENHQIDKQYDEKYISQTTNIHNPNPVLSTIYNSSQTPACGNITMSEVYKYIPNFIGENAVGFDNHTYFMSFLVKVPIVFHYKRILHKHDSRRMNNISLLRYWHGIAKMIDYDCNHYKFIQLKYGDKLCENGFGINAIISNCTEQIPRYFENTFLTIPIDLRLERIERLAKDIMFKTKSVKYCKVGEYLISNKYRIIEELDDDYIKSLELQRNWLTIIDVTSGYSVADIANTARLKI